MKKAVIASLVAVSVYAADPFSETQHTLFAPYQVQSSFDPSAYTVSFVPGQGYFYCNAGDGIKQHLIEGRQWESHAIDLMRRYVKPGSVAIDIGAHIGTHTVTLSSAVGDEGRVIAIEPQDKIYSELEANCRLNGCQNVTFLRCAAGAVQGMAYLSAEVPRNEGARYISSKQQVEPVSLIKLDDWELDNVSFMKIDVESYELEVLAGAKETIERNHPAILIEVGGGLDREREEGVNGYDHIHQVLNLLEKELNYVVVNVEGNDYLALHKTAIDEKAFNWKGEYSDEVFAAAQEGVDNVLVVTSPLRCSALQLQAQLGEKVRVAEWELATNSQDTHWQSLNQRNHNSSLRQWLKSTSIESVQSVQFGEFDLIYLDLYSIHSDIMHALFYFYSGMKKGAILCGSDWMHEGTYATVQQFVRMYPELTLEIKGNSYFLKRR